MGLALLILYMVLLGFGTMITPGVGISGKFITMLPHGLTESSHLPAYGLLMWLSVRGLLWRKWPLSHAVFTAAAGAMVFGLWMEIVQGFVPGRVVSIDDVIANGIGIGIATMLIIWRAKSWQHTNKVMLDRPYSPGT